MKWKHAGLVSGDYQVAPLVGAWIEIKNQSSIHLTPLVAPLVGAWIEILKPIMQGRMGKVAPLVGAWIEICLCEILEEEMSRSPCGSVD